MKPLFLFVLCLASIGCGAAATPDSRANLQVLRSEHTADKLTERGLGFAELGDLTRAEQYLAAALEQGAPAREVLPPLLHVCVAAARHRAALVYAHEYGAALAQDPHFAFLLGVLEAAVGSPDAALRELRHTLRDLPDHADAHYQLALLLERRDGDESELAHHLREYLRLAPEGPFAEDARSKLSEHRDLDASGAPAARNAGAAAMPKRLAQK